jgi:aminocarboxymuconate-semialdehyde decarboxylase
VLARAQVFAPEVLTRELATIRRRRHKGVREKLTTRKGHTMTVIDVHAHVLAEDTIRLLQREAPAAGVKLSPIDSEYSVLEVAGSAYRPFPRGGWDLERRFRDMDAAEVDMQVVSNTPQTFLYGQEAQLTAATARLQNDQIARLVAAHPNRFKGIATLPMQAPELAAGELARAIGAGLVGAHIGSNINGRNLDDPALEPVWAQAAALGAFILIHPVGVAGADRLKSYYLANLIGNPVDTTIAAASLVFGGVMERFPSLKICLAHGGGFVPYQADRWVHGWQVRGEPKVNLKISPQASLRRFYYDTILHGAPALEFLVRSAGAGHVLLGSDYPFDMGTPECVRQVRAASLSPAERATVLGEGAVALLDARGGVEARAAAQ